MSCEIMNDQCPFEIKCLFPTAANDTRVFSLYFYSSQGSQEQVVSCAYNGRYKCFHGNGFNSTHEAYNNLTITVPDTFATREGSLGCHKGDISMVKKCPYPPPEICNTIRITNSEIGLGTTTQDYNTSIVIGVPIGVVAVIILLLVLGIVLFMRHRAKQSLMNFKKPKISTDGSPVGDEEDGSSTKMWSKKNSANGVIVEERAFLRYNDGESASSQEGCNEPFIKVLGKEYTGTYNEEKQIDSSSATCLKVEIKNSPINRFQQESTVDENTTTVDQEHTHTDKTSGVYTGEPVPRP